MTGVTPESGISRFLRYVAIERGLAQNTVDAYRRDLAAYADWLRARGILDLGLVQPETLADYVAEMRGADRAVPGASADPGAPVPLPPGDGALTRRVYSPETISRRLSTVRGMHRFLFEEGELPSFAGSGVRTPKKGRPLPHALSIADIEAMLASTGGDTPVGLRDRALLELLYASGARVSEVTALDVDDLLSDVAAADAWTDPERMLLQGGLLRVTGKGSKERLVPYGSHAGRALAAYLVRARPTMNAAGRGTPALFVGPRGARMSRQSVWLVIRAAAERAEITENVSPHSMRHSFATHLLAGGADVRTVQELLGHSSVTTTQIYTQVTADTLREHYLTAHPRARE